MATKISNSDCDSWLDSLGRRLEQYTLKRPNEALLVAIETDGQTDEVAIFKGFSSLLMNWTAFDPGCACRCDFKQIALRSEFG
jgi:hypothetical protein